MSQEEPEKKYVQEECVSDMFRFATLVTTIEWRLYKLTVYSIRMLRFPAPCRKCPRNGCPRRRSQAPSDLE